MIQATTTHSRTPSRLLLLGALLSSSYFALWIHEAQAQSNQRNNGTVEEVVVTGTKRVGVSSLDLAVPIDVLSGEDLQAQNSSDILDVLTTLAPSYNVAREPISDAATFVRPASLRGLPSDSALILVNSKRRHKSAVVAEFTAGLNKGSHSVDISAIPTIALEQIEVLRDGASAQYGSDAISGVINLRMSTDPTIRKIKAQIGQTYSGDGANFTISGIWGFNLGAEGYLTTALEYKQAKPVNRALPSSDVLRLREDGYPVVSEPQVWGAPEIDSDLKLVYNLGAKAGAGEFYSFGNFSQRKVDGSFFYRSPLGRTNVYVRRYDPDNPSAGGINPDGDGTLLVVDTTVDQNAGCPPLRVEGFVVNEADLTALKSDDDCFAFNEILPGGFTPRFVGEVTDTAVAGGYRGENNSGSLRYDISAAYGASEVQYNLNNTINASYGAATLRDFYIGSQTQTEFLVNADIVQTVDIGGASPLNIAYGAQFLTEKYEIKPGQVESYAVGNDNLPVQGFSIAANGFAGFSPAASGSFSRESVSGYVDFEIEATERWLTSIAMRYEDYSDFGDTFNIKFANRIRVSELLNLRAAVSTGFRAPSSGQSGLQRLSTSINSSGALAEELLVLPNSPIAVRLGGGPLGPETSVNFSFGAVVNTDSFELALDYFNITVDDRLSRIELELSDEDQMFLRMTNPDSLVEKVSFFRNVIDTRTQGIDLVAKFPYQKGDHYGDISFLFNWTDTKVRDVLRPENIAKPLLTDPQRRIIEEGLPAVRFNVAWHHDIGDWSWLVRLNYFDKITESLFSSDSLTFETSDIVYVDTEVTWKLPVTSAEYSITVGARNLFDAYLDRNPYANMPTSSGAAYPLAHPAGFQGGSFYGRISVNF